MLVEQCALMHINFVFLKQPVCVFLLACVLLRMNTVFKTKSNYNFHHIFLTQYAWSKIISVSPQKSDKFSQ